MNQSELVSIIVPIYNSEKYLNDCLKSIQKQTYHNIEILLIDDGSQDNSLVICEEVGVLDDRIKIYHQENQGVSAARNRGIELAKGKYILFIDSDDMIIDNMVEQMLLIAKEHLLVICEYKRMEDEVNAITSQNKKIDVIELDRTSFWELYKKNLINSPCNKLYEREILLKGIQFSKGLSLGEDLLFNLDYLKYIEGFVYLKQVCYYYRNTGLNSLSNKYYENGFEIQIRLYQNLIKFCQIQKKFWGVQWGELYWYYFKSLQVALDAEFEKNFYKNDKEIIKKMKSTEFKRVLDKVRKNRSELRLVNRLELFLYYCNMWKLNYWLRRKKMSLKECWNSRFSLANKKNARK